MYLPDLGAVPVMRRRVPQPRGMAVGLRRLVGTAQTRPAPRHFPVVGGGYVRPSFNVGTLPILRRGGLGEYDVPEGLGIFGFVGKAIKGIGKGIGAVASTVGRTVGGIAKTAIKVPLFVGKTVAKIPIAAAKTLYKGGKFVATKAIPAVGKVAINVAKKAAPIAKLIPGPHQAAAFAFDSIANSFPSQQPQQQFPVYQGGGGGPINFAQSDGTPVEVGTVQPSAINPLMLGILGIGAVLLLQSPRRGRK